MKLSEKNKETFVFIIMVILILLCGYMIGR